MEATNTTSGTTPNVTSRAASGGAPVSMQKVSRSFGTVRALNGLSLDIAPGELVALLGPSGCGKTTALRILAGFETADSGTVSVDGKDIAPVPAAKRDMGMVFQSYSLFPNMSALDNVGFGLRMRKMGAAGRRRRAHELLELVGLSALDAKVRLQLREQIRSLQQRLGITTLFVTHDQEEALSMADRVGVMKDGSLEQIAVPAELYTRPATAFVAEFVGTMNRIPGELSRGGQATALGTVTDVQAGCADLPPGPVDVLVRPENLRIAAIANGNGIVTSRTFLGSVSRIHVLLSGDVTVQVDVPSATAGQLLPGASVQVSLDGSPVQVAGRA